MTTDPSTPNPGPVLRVADLPAGQPRDVHLEPDAETCGEIAANLGLLGLRKLRMAGTLAPLGKRDWEFRGSLGATVVQPCVVTLEPVTTRIDEAVHRIWIKGLEAPEAEETEMPEDVDQEPLGAEIDLGAVMVEALALSLPDFPRAAGVELGEAVYTEPGKQAMTDEAARPFAGLAGLRDKLAADEDDES